MCTLETHRRFQVRSLHPYAWRTDTIHLYNLPCPSWTSLYCMHAGMSASVRQRTRGSSKHKLRQKMSIHLSIYMNKNGCLYASMYVCFCLPHTHTTGWIRADIRCLWSRDMEHTIETLIEQPNYASDSGGGSRKQHNLYPSASSLVRESSFPYSLTARVYQYYHLDYHSYWLCIN